MFGKLKVGERMAPGAEGAGPRPDSRRCPWVESRLWGFVECELPATERSAVAAHLAGCPSCAGRHVSTVRARAALAPACAPVIADDVTPALAAAVARRLVERDAVRAERAGRARCPMPGAAGMLWGTAVVLAGWGFVALLPVSNGLAFRGENRVTARPTATRVATATPVGAALGIAENALTPGPSPKGWERGALGGNPARFPFHHPGKAPLSQPLGEGPGVRAFSATHPKPARGKAGTARVAGRHVTFSRPAVRRLPVPPPRSAPPEVPVWLVEEPPTLAPVASNEPVMLVREVEPSTPSYAYARSVLPAADGERAMIVEVTREQQHREDPVRVTLVLAGAAGAAETEKD